MPVLPSGTVTFLFTDIEGSTAHWEQHPEEMRAALARHDAILRTAIECHDGAVFKTVGDAFCAAFALAADAVNAALAAQRALVTEAAGSRQPATGDSADGPAAGSRLPAPLHVRMAIHTGGAEQRDGDYFGQPLNRVARLLAAGHGGQVLLSDAAAALVRYSLPESVGLRDLGAHRLRDLIGAEHVFQLVAPGLATEFLPLRTLDTHPNNLPVQRTPLIGREREIAAVTDTLRRADVGVLTLTGPGGTGKTRLALQAGADLLDDFADGVYFVALAPVSDSTLVAATIAQTLGVRDGEGRSPGEAIQDFLRDRQMLLVLDNFEQIVAAAPLISDLLAACPRLTVLVTSRVVLHLHEEKEFPVPPLGLPPRGPHPPTPSPSIGGGGVVSTAAERVSPPPALGEGPGVGAIGQYGAVALFIQRAQDVKPDFAVTNDTAPAVAEICHRLDGLPLAIELAAARIRILTPQAMLARLDQRLKLLTGGARDLPARQQTLRDTIAWSHDLLDEAERTLFRRLAVFAGGCTFEAAEAVCNADGDLGLDVFDGITSLVEKNLLRQTIEADGEPRFLMLETIREFALEQLEASGEAEAARGYHAAFFASLAKEADPQMRSGARPAWKARLAAEYDNLRAALAWYRDRGDAEAGMELAADLAWFWLFRGQFSEGRDWLEGMLALRSASAAPTEQTRALFSDGFLAVYTGDYATAGERLEASLTLARALGDRHVEAHALLELGERAYFQGDYPYAWSLDEEGVALAREAGDAWMVAYGLVCMLLVAGAAGERERVHRLAEECLTLGRHFGDAWITSFPVMTLGRLALSEGDYATARMRFEEALALRRREQDKFLSAHSLAALGAATWHQQDFEASRASFAEGLNQFREVGSHQGVAICLAGFAQLAQSGADPDRAARLFGAAEALRDAIGAGLTLMDRPGYERAVADTRTALGDEAFARAWAAGRALTPDAAIALALEQQSRPPA
jgi:predicted ATPase/class 3 adenylate cyclase